MGSRIIMMLGWKGEQIVDKAKELGIFLDAGNPNTFYDVQAEEINEALIAIQRNVVENELNFTIENEYEDNDDGIPMGYYFQVLTPKGIKELKSMEVQTSGEIYGKEDIEDILFGIGLNGTFSRVIMDWDTGRMGEGVFSFSVTEEKIRLYQKIKEELVKKYPVFHDAEWLMELEWM